MAWVSVWTLIASTARLADGTKRAMTSAAAAAIAFKDSRPRQQSGQASSHAARKDLKQPLRAGKRRLAPRNTSSPEPLTPALCAEFTTAERTIRGCRQPESPDYSMQSFGFSSGWGVLAQEKFPFDFKGSVQFCRCAYRFPCGHGRRWLVQVEVESISGLMRPEASSGSTFLSTA